MASIFDPRPFSAPGEKNFRENGPRSEDLGCDRDWNLTFMRSGSANRDDRNVNTVRAAGRTDPKRTVWGTRSESFLRRQTNRSNLRSNLLDRYRVSWIRIRGLILINNAWTSRLQQFVPVSRNIYLRGFSRMNGYRGVSYFHWKKVRWGFVLSKYLRNTHSFELLLSIFVRQFCSYLDGLFVTLFIFEKKRRSFNELYIRRISSFFLFL